MHALGVGRLAWVHINTKLNVSHAMTKGVVMKLLDVLPILRGNSMAGDPHLETRQMALQGLRSLKYLIQLDYEKEIGDVLR